MVMEIAEKEIVLLQKQCDKEKRWNDLTAKEHRQWQEECGYEHDALHVWRDRYENINKSHTATIDAQHGREDVAEKLLASIAEYDLRIKEAREKATENKAELEELLNPSQ